MASMELDLQLVSDKEIEKLEKAKRLLKEIKQIDGEFRLSNVLDIDKDSILVFNIKDTILSRTDLDDISKQLSDTLKVRCLVLPSYLSLEKTINNRKYIYDCATGKTSLIK